MSDIEHSPIEQSSIERPSSPGKVKLFLVSLVGLLVLGLLAHLYFKDLHFQKLVKTAEENAVTYVQTTKVNAQTNQQTLNLPGTVLGMNEANIYSRANGFVKKWHKDIGQSVKKDELLAELVIPEVEKQVEEAKTNFELARKAYVRWKALREADAVSQQEFDEKTNSYHQTRAVLKRLNDQLAFREVRAPFEGIVTKRNVNVGDLVNSGNAGPTQALFTVSQNSQLKVYAYVPQNIAQEIQIGLEVSVSLADKPDQKVIAHVSKIAAAIDAVTRTMQVEIALPEGTKLLPGYFVQTVFKLENQNRVVIPTKTLLFGVKGIEVAVVKDGVVQRKPVILGVDYGQNIEIKSGVEFDDEIIINPPDSINSGQHVTVSNESKKK